MASRRVKRISKSVPTLEGAGVHLRRAFGFGKTSDFDPFLLLDDFRSDDPEKYMAGFPWHPHRGIETITYMLDGVVEHGDSLGNKGLIQPGEVQWMTAGSGIIHQEMPAGDAHGRMGGFQLWANLPANRKMMDPRYREVKSDEIPEVKLPGGVAARIIAGSISGINGPVRDIVIDPVLMDIRMPENTAFSYPTQTDHTVFCYVHHGSGFFEPDGAAPAEDGKLVLYEQGDEIMVHSHEETLHFLFISGKPIGEPVAWYGPIVMNSQQEIDIARQELQDNTFIKYKG